MTGRGLGCEKSSLVYQPKGELIPLYGAIWGRRSKMVYMSMLLSLPRMALKGRGGATCMPQVESLQNVVLFTPSSYAAEGVINLYEEILKMYL